MITARVMRLSSIWLALWHVGALQEQTLIRLQRKVALCCRCCWTATVEHTSSWTMCGAIMTLIAGTHTKPMKRSCTANSMAQLRHVPCALVMQLHSMCHKMYKCLCRHCISGVSNHTGNNRTRTILRLSGRSISNRLRHLMGARWA